MKDNAFYFPHDQHARSDPKITQLIKEMKWEGYGIFWALIEKLHESGGSLKFDKKVLSFDLRIKEEKLDKIVNNYKLFYFIGENLFSKRVLINLRVRKNKSLKARKSARIRWGYNKKNNLANALQLQYDSNAIKERKGKERKLPPTPQGEPVDNSKKLEKIDGEIKAFRSVLKWDNSRIKENLLQRGLLEVEIDKALGKEF